MFISTLKYQHLSNHFKSIGTSIRNGITKFRNRNVTYISKLRMSKTYIKKVRNGIESNIT